MKLEPISKLSIMTKFGTKQFNEPKKSKKSIPKEFKIELITIQTKEIEPCPKKSLKNIKFQTWDPFLFSRSRHRLLLKILIKF